MRDMMMMESLDIATCQVMNIADAYQAYMQIAHVCM